MTIVKATVLKAGVVNVNGDVYTEECLRKAAERNPTTLKFEDGCLVAEIPFNKFARMTSSGEALDLRKYECGDECERCEAKDGEFVIHHLKKDLVKIKLELCNAATMYHWNGTGENPNRPITFCQFCKEEYYDHWNEKWAEYRSSQGFGFY